MLHVKRARSTGINNKAAPARQKPAEGCGMFSLCGNQFRIVPSRRGLADYSAGGPGKDAPFPLYTQQDTAREIYVTYRGYGVSLKPSGAAKAGSPGCLGWQRGKARAIPA